MQRPPPERNYWVGVVSRSHVLIAAKGGFLQLNHGKRAPLQKIKSGDGVVMYSPRTAYPDGEPYQRFTAIGRVKSGELYQVEMAPDFKPYRLDVEFFKAREARIHPLIEQLSFIKSKTHWGAAFRFGHLRIDRPDFSVIAKAMGRDVMKDF
jgi:hypothetical protein